MLNEHIYDDLIFNNILALKNYFPFTLCGINTKRSLLKTRIFKIFKTQVGVSEFVWTCSAKKKKA